MTKVRFTKQQLRMLQRARNAENHGEVYKIDSSHEVYVAKRLRWKGLITFESSDGLGYAIALTERGRFVADEQGVGAGGRISQLHRYTFNQEALDALDGGENE